MIRRELKINLKSLIIWAGIMIALYTVVFAIYPSITESMESSKLDEMMKMFPKEVLESFNMDIVSIDSAYGWYKTEGYMFLTLLGGIYAAILGSTILTKEENDKTIEFLFSKPVSRNRIVTSKIIAGVLNILIFIGFITIYNFVALKIGGKIDIKEYLMVALIPLLLYLCLFAISLFISTFLKKTKTAMGFGIGITFISYILQIIGGMSDKVKILKQTSLFEFVSSRYIIQNGNLDEKYIFIGLGIIAACIIGTYIRYNRKELV